MDKFNLHTILERFKNKKSTQWLLLLLALGVGMLLFSSYMQSHSKNTRPSTSLALEKEQQQTTSTDTTTSKSATGIRQSEVEYEQQVGTLLSKIVGVEDVSVMINLDSDEINEFAVETRESNQSTNELKGNRSISQNNTDKKIAHYRNNNSDLPVIVKRVKPKVRGVLVVARGIENLEVKAVVIEAINRLLDVPPHRISVLPKGH